LVKGLCLENIGEKIFHIFEAVKLLLEFCFDRLGLNRVELEVREYNKKAMVRKG
jgi:hypothetical protein